MSNTPNNREIITLSRKVSARLVPSGALVELPEGTEVFITQDLGGDYTVNVYGNLAMLDSKDADALGKEVKDCLEGVDVENTPIEEIIMLLLKSCYDPEIPVNIVDLGLIYESNVESIKDTKNQYKVSIQMTLTAPGCGMGPTIIENIRQKLLRVSKIVEVEVQIVFDPPWTQDKMSDAAKLQLGLL